MKAYLESMAAYNLWANQRVENWILQAGEGACTQIQSCSFPTVRETLLHVWNAQDVWMKRLDGESPLSWPNQQFSGSAAEVASGLVAGSIRCRDWVRLQSPDQLEAEISYANLKGDPFTNRVSEILAHMFNHATFHRGQVVTMLRTAGFTRFEPTDLIAFYRD